MRNDATVAMVDDATATSDFGETAGKGKMNNSSLPASQRAFQTRDCGMVVLSA